METHRVVRLDGPWSQMRCLYEKGCEFDKMRGLIYHSAIGEVLCLTAEHLRSTDMSTCSEPHRAYHDHQDSPNRGHTAIRLAVMRPACMTAICTIRTKIIAMTMDLLRRRKHVTQDDRHIRENIGIAGCVEVPKIGRAAAAAIILWGCVMISFAWATFLVLVTLQR
ncbi:hypothetical protein BZM26_34575 [Paraburkholderia strydomiana]|nr:hypothetical protein BZM26_34575 [Paraburkholderia strydomiana]